MEVVHAGLLILLERTSSLVRIGNALYTVGNIREPQPPLLDKRSYS